MNLYSTKNPDYRVSLKEAVFKSMPPDNGLYMPVEIPVLPEEFWRTLETKSFREISFEVAKALLQNSIEEEALHQIIDEAINFPASIKEIEENIHVLELFHGPSMAFKDFGARFMSRVMQYFLKKEQKDIDILVATSGDTGGAVALGFYDVPGIKVTILFPKGKVSLLQEQQLTTLGGNITALEIDGAFDDCQRMVKSAFLDSDLNQKKNLSSANSINIARLIPQTFYYFEAYKQLKKQGRSGAFVLSVPSGNFGNMTAGLIAREMGLPVQHFVASTNVNDAVPQYLENGIFDPKPSLHTISNAMDVGNPSNFVRMQELFGRDIDQMRKMISGYRFTDKETRETIRKVFDASGYVLCPHTAIAYAGLKQYLDKNNQEKGMGVFISTAHPCKFPDVYPDDIREHIETPQQAANLKDKEKQVISMSNDFEGFKEWLIRRG